MAQKLAQLRVPDETRVVVVTGAGKSFSAGRDLKATLQHTEEEAKEYLSMALRSVLAIYDLKIPTIAAIHGHAIGYGMELSMACDFRIAHPTTIFKLPETALGIFPGAGGCFLLPALVGQPTALDWILNPRDITADEALAKGFLHRIANNPVETAIELAEKIAKNGPLGVQTAKKWTRQHHNYLDPGLLDLYFKERHSLTQSEDHKKALNEFFNKK